LSYARGRRAERTTDTRSVPSLTLISVRLARHPGTRLGPAHGTSTIWPKDPPAVVATLLAVSVAVAISITVPFCCGPAGANAENIGPLPVRRHDDFAPAPVPP
jgi:hypothetical protein